MTNTSTQDSGDQPVFRSRYGPQQLRDLLGLAEFQHERATQAGIMPRPDAAGGKWSGKVARVMYAHRVGIRRNAGSVPDLGAERAAEFLAARLGIEVEPHAVHELGRQGRILIVGYYKEHPLYCGRSLENWHGVDEVEQANITGERLIADRAADRLGIRRSDFAHLVRLGWISPVAWGRGPFTAKKYSPDVPLYRAGDITDLLNDPAINWDAVRAVPAGKRSALANLPDRNTDATEEN